MASRPEFTTWINNVEDAVEVRQYTAAGTAKFIRAALKASFPGVKFSVKTDTYAGGASVRVAYVDGPAVSAVQKVTNPYAGADFDGMTDSMDYRGPTLLALDDKTEPVLASWGANFVFVNRRLSPERLVELEDMIEAAGTYSHSQTPGLTEVEIEGVGHLSGFGTFSLTQQLHDALIAR